MNDLRADTAALPREWRRVRNVLRAVLGLACLYAQFLIPGPPRPAVSAFAVLFAVYGMAVLLLPRLDRVQASLLGLFVETAFFVVFSAYGTDRAGWLGSVFYLYLMTAAVIGHDRGDVFIAAGVSLGFFAFVRSPEAEALRRVVLIAGLLACLLAFHKRRLQDRLADAADREQKLREEAEQIRDGERQRIAADFHDGPLQTFIGLQVRLDILGTLLKRDRAAGMEDLSEIQQIAKTQVSEIRSFLRSMRPVEAEAGDLLTATRRIIEYFQKDTGIAARFTSTESALRVAPESSHEILQILREALHNVQKHAKASRVVVAMERSGKTVEITVDDDGTGFSFSGTFSLDELDLLRLGPQSIRRRVRALSGELTIESRPGHGAGLKIRIPV